MNNQITGSGRSPLFFRSRTTSLPSETEERNRKNARGYMSWTLLLTTEQDY